MAKKLPEIEELVRPKGLSADESEAIRREAGEKLSVNQLVKAKGEGFDVFSESGKAHVSRDLNSTNCTCADFDGASTMGIPDYKCEHIFAVKHFTMFGGESVQETKQDIVFEGNGEISHIEAPTESTRPEPVPQPDVEPETPEGLSFIGALSRPLPKALIKEREMPWKRGSYLQYIDWPTVADILDKVADTNWSFEIVDIKIGDTSVCVHSNLTVFGVRRDGLGVSEVHMSNNGPMYETAIKAAASDSLKRAAVLFGVARELYKQEDAPPQGQERAASFQGNVATPNGSPVAKSLGDMVTAKQLGMIRAIAKDIGVDADAESRITVGCSIEELNKKAASDVIEHLMQLQRGGGPTEPAPVASRSW